MSKQPNKTLGDKINNFITNYIAPTKEEQKVSKKELPLAYPRGEKTVSGWGTDELSVEECGEVAEQCPILMKGIKKRTKDSTTAWFHLEKWDSKIHANHTIKQIIWDFENRTNFKKKFNKAVENASVYGNGFLIISFLGDKASLDSPPTPGSEPYYVRVVHPKYIKEIDYKNKYWKEKKIMHFKYRDREHYGKDSEKWIHPDRIIHVPGDTYGDNRLGKSKVNLLRNTIKSKINVDIASGELLAWFAHGVFDVSVPGLNENEEVRKKWEEILKSHPGGFVHDEDEELKAVDPKAISPKAFYDWIVLNIAACLVMPTHVLMGIQVGRVTGAEVGFGDYYKDIKDTQELDYSPIIANLYKRLLKSKGKKWQYDIIWNPVYIDETAETEIMKGRAEAIKWLREAGVIDTEDAREIYNRGQIELDPKKSIDEVKPEENPDENNS